MIDKLSLHNAYNTVRKMIPCSVYIHSMIIIFVINFEKWDTQTQALDIKLFDIIKKHLLYTHQRIVQNTGGTKQWNTNQQIVFSVSPQCDFPNPYHVCLTKYVELLFVQRKTNA